MKQRCISFACAGVFYVLAVIACVLALMGCNSTTTSTSEASIAVQITPGIAAVGTGQTMQFTASVSGMEGVTWSATAGTVSSSGLYTAPSGGPSMTVTVTATSTANSSKFGTAKVNVVAPGQVAATANVQVASYTIAPAAAGNVSVQFGTTTNYGLTTWNQGVPSGGGPVNLFVAGMIANTLYHMRGVVQFADGSQYTDPDMTFTTGSAPAATLPVIATATTAGATPQSGLELLSLVGSAPSIISVAVTDMNGNIVWTYNPALPQGVLPSPAKLISNGNFLINNYNGAAGDGVGSVLQEVDLTGKVIWQMTAADLNNALASATCPGCKITVVGTHHDFQVLPNGHILVLGATQQQIGGTTVTGDVVIDLDQNRNPVWLWNGFNHLDINRHPYMWPDWTHTNAILYSSDDGNIIISMRHQNWLIKIDYENGNGSGAILWHLGYQGDFQLMGGTDPTDWFYAQHGPSFVSKNTTGNFTLALFDNGDDRVFPSDVTCGASGAPPCLYSTVQIWNIDESAKTATLSTNMPAPSYSFFGGNAEVLANGDLEFCESAGGPGVAGQVYEYTQGSSPQQVWQLNVTAQYPYRGVRIGSMYPGVQW